MLQSCGFVLVYDWLNSSVLFLAFGEVFACIGVREPLPNASQAFTKFGDAHRTMEKFAITTLKQLKPVGISIRWH